MAYIYELILIYAPAARLCRLSSTRRLLERRKGTNRSGSALLCGDVDYYARFAPTPTTNDSLAFSLYCGNRTEFPLLTHSAEEIEGIRLTRHTAADSLLCGAQATEQAFRQLATRYPLVGQPLVALLAADKAHRTDAELSVRVGSRKAYDALNSHSLARTRVYTKVCTTCCHPSPVTDGFTCWRHIIWEHCVRKRMQKPP